MAWPLIIWSRRDVLKALSCSAAAIWVSSLFSRSVLALPSHSHSVVPTSSRREVFLTVGETAFAPTGKKRTAITVNGTVPGPVLRWKEGETVVIHVTNTLKEATSIHWHGIMLPFDMDGVPGVSFKGILPGETFTYEFLLKQSGTYWYHAHSDFQEQLGHYGAIVIDPATPDPVACDREHVLLLSDWSDQNPKRILGNLKRHDGWYNWNRKTVGDFFRDVKRDGFGKAFADHRMWAEMRMTPTDISDVTGYTFLLNGKTATENEWLPYQAGEKIRLRIINGSAMTFFDVRIPGLKMTVVQADGQNVLPVTVDQLRLGPAETYDVTVEPSLGPHTFFAEAMDRTGYARATLSVEPGVEAPLPPRLERPVRTLADMPEMEGHNSLGEHTHSMTDMTTMDHSVHGMTMHGAAHHKILDYADLMPLEHRHGLSPAREVDVVLEGNMQRYIWTINGRRMQEAEPILLALNERVRLNLKNRTMMEHTMHLHGMFVELVGADGRAHAKKHTVIVGPNRQVSVDLTADAPGPWAFHCHMLFHMLAGMFTTVMVAENVPGVGHDHS